MELFHPTEITGFPGSTLYTLYLNQVASYFTRDFTVTFDTSVTCKGRCGVEVGWFGLKVEYLEDLMERLVLFGFESVGYSEKTLQNTKALLCFLSGDL